MPPLLEALALAYQYPRLQLLPLVEEKASQAPQSPGKKRLHEFLTAFSELSLAQREELYTRTLDLTPLTAPNVGYAVYGEDYRRGRLMAQLNAEYTRLGIDTANEIPDHLIPVLRYLAVARPPLPELIEVLEAALEQIGQTLRTLEPHNPYLPLLEATRLAVQPYVRGAGPVTVGSLFGKLPPWKGGTE